VLSPEHRAKLSAAKKGKVHSPETRAKIGAARKGKPMGPQSPEHRAKIKAAAKARAAINKARTNPRADLRGYRKDKKQERRASAPSDQKALPSGSFDA
jgi:hypothetical protein